MNNTKENASTTGGSDFQKAIAKLIPAIKKQPADFQLKMLWILFEALSADVEQLKAYRDVDSAIISNQALLFENATIDNSALNARLTAEMENISKDFT